MIIEVFNILKGIFEKYKSKETLKKIAVPVALMVVLIIILEGVFMFVPRSHFYGGSYASRVWFNYYWHQNSFKCRDNEINTKSPQPAIFFVGDSFTAGHGIKNTNNRFSNIVANQMSSYNVVNIGQNGADTRMEYNRMIDIVKQTGIVPKKIVLQYFGNDIERVAKSEGLDFNGFDINNGSSLNKWLCTSSFLYNYLYWIFPHGDTKPYIDFLQKSYHSQNVLNRHFEDLTKFLDYSSQNNIQLVVVIFPFMQDIGFSKSLYTDLIRNFLNSKNITTIDVGELVKSMPVRDLCVNANDGHASVMVNKIVGEEILKKIK